MELKTISSTGKPLTKLTPRQQQRFIEEISKQQDVKVKLGMEMALMILGYEVVEGLS